MRVDRTLTLAAAVGVIAASAVAGSPGATPPSAPPSQHQALCGAIDADASCIVVPIDHVRPLKLTGDIGAVLIGNPMIADVTMVTPNTAVLTAQSVGATNLLALDRDGEQIAAYTVIVHEPTLKRVILRNGPRSAGLYQCAPLCERTLSQSDTPDVHTAQAGVIVSDLGVAATASGAPQTGVASGAPTEDGAAE